MVVIGYVCAGGPVGLACWCAGGGGGGGVEGSHTCARLCACVRMPWRPKDCQCVVT